MPFNFGEKVIIPFGHLNHFFKMVEMAAQTLKRAGSPLTKDAEASSKKQKEKSSESLPDNAFSLRLSAVYFTGEAKCVVGDADEEYLEKVEEDEKGLWQPTVPPSTDLPVQPSSWSEPDSAFVYRLVSQFSFIYKRSTYVGENGGDAWSVILHEESDEQSPLLFLHPAELNHPFDRIEESVIPGEGVIPSHASRYTWLKVQALRDIPYMIPLSIQALNPYKNPSN
ncbi:hypothetical protein BDZ89DRAFT_1053800 [Hymenopellis radicata]|nr:hypothetical protein BDZ89DRAFT_1053800 [Hymenopellis radicata]